MRFIKDKRGSLTVEAAVVLPIFICVIMSITFLIKLVYVQEIVQHAITQSANELSTYSYLYSVSGIKGIQDTVNTKLTERKELFERHMDDTINAYNSLSTTKARLNAATADINNGEIDKAVVEIDNIKAQAGDTGTKLKQLEADMATVVDNPRQEAISMLCLVAKGAYEGLKAQILVPIVKTNIKKYFGINKSTDIEQRMEALNIVGGFGGLDFSQSRLFENNKDIDIIVRYRIKLPLPFNYLPQLDLIQRSTARAWLDGDDNSAATGGTGQGQEDDIWSLRPTERGKKIQEKFGRNMPSNYPVITSFDPVSGRATCVRSIDVRAESYKDRKELEKTLKNFINDLANVKTVKYKSQTYRINEKDLVIVIPKGTSNAELQALMSECARYANQKGVIITFKEL